MKVVTVKLDDDLTIALEKMAAETGKNKSDIMREAFQQMLKTKENKNTEIALLQQECKQLENTIHAMNAIMHTNHQRIEDLKENIDRTAKMYEIALDDKNSIINEKQRIIDRVEVESSDYRGNMEKALQEANNYRSLLLQYASYGFIKRMLFKIDSSKL